MHSLHHQSGQMDVLRQTQAHGERAAARPTTYSRPTHISGWQAAKYHRVVVFIWQTVSVEFPSAGWSSENWPDDGGLRHALLRLQRSCLPVHRLPSLKQTYLLSRLQLCVCVVCVKLVRVQEGIFLHDHTRALVLTAFLTFFPHLSVQWHYIFIWTYKKIKNCYRKLFHI